MTTTLVQENAEGTRLQLRIEPGQPPKLRLITKNEVEVLFWRYEYWEVSRATKDFWTLAAWMSPGEGEYAVLCEANEAVGLSGRDQGGAEREAAHQAADS